MIQQRVAGPPYPSGSRGVGLASVEAGGQVGAEDAVVGAGHAISHGHKLRRWYMWASKVLGWFQLARHGACQQ